MNSSLLISHGIMKYVWRQKKKRRDASKKWNGLYAYINRTEKKKQKLWPDQEITHLNNFQILFCGGQKQEWKRTQKLHQVHEHWTEHGEQANVKILNSSKDIRLYNSWLWSRCFDAGLVFFFTRFYSFVHCRNEN